MAATTDIPFRIVVLEPPSGVLFRLQSGKTPGDLIPPVASSRSALVFEFMLSLGKRLPDGRPRFLGSLAQGTPTERFVYVNSGSLAGQVNTPWTRRAKVHLSSITSSMIREVTSSDGACLEAQFMGTSRDGGPSCASVPLAGGGWHVARGTPNRSQVKKSALLGRLPPSK